MTATIIFGEEKPKEKPPLRLKYNEEHYKALHKRHQDNVASSGAPLIEYEDFLHLCAKKEQATATIAPPTPACPFGTRLAHGETPSAKLDDWVNELMDKMSD